MRPSGLSQSMRYVLAILVLALAALAQAGSLTALENRKIQYLISTIESLPDAQFIRNGTAYDAKSAADHLRPKLREAGSRLVTADDFIRLCASVSSVSGLPYQIRFADGSTITSEVFLRQKLREFEQASQRKGAE